MKENNRAYSDLYIEEARENFAYMMAHAHYELGYGLDEFMEMFLSTEISKLYGEGNPKYTVGRTGVELAREVIYHHTGEWTNKPTDGTMPVTVPYWAGLMLAYYQWYRNKSFKEINEKIKFNEISNMFYPLHEAGDGKFVSVMDEMLQ